MSVHMTIELHMSVHMSTYNRVDAQNASFTDLKNYRGLVG